ncbi:acyl dehydratase [Novosphingobium sp. 1529]|uniref:MaoC family dehydratase n=1 Tax=Novosphingobium sp. 1529 TaxID=3156424 RepID=UPI001494817F
MPEHIACDGLASRVGTTLGTSRWITIDQAMIDAFAELTGDRQWVHVDVERANRELGSTIAHGHLTLSLLPQMLADIVEITGVAHGLNYGLDKVRFLEKVGAGSRVRGHQSLLAIEPRGAGLLARFGVKIEIEGQARPACIAEALVLLFPEPPA